MDLPHALGEQKKDSLDHGSARTMFVLTAYLGINSASHEHVKKNDVSNKSKTRDSILFS